MDRPLLHIISHTDLDGVAAAALAWHVKGGRVARVSLTGYGEVDALILETLASGKEPLVLDLFCQKEQTIDEVDRPLRRSPPAFSFRPPQEHLRTLRQQEMGRHRHELLRRATVYWNWMSERRAGLADEGGARAARADRAHSERPRPLARADTREPSVAGARHDVRPLGDVRAARGEPERGADARGVRRSVGIHGTPGGALRRGEGAYMEARR